MESDLSFPFPFSSAHSLSRVWLFATPWTTAHQGSLSITNSWGLLKLMSTESVMPSNHLILSRPLLLLPSVFPSIRVFSNKSVLRIRRPKYWSFSFSISPSNEYSVLIFFRIDCLDLLAFQGILKCLLPQHSSKIKLPQVYEFSIQALGVGDGQGSLACCSPWGCKESDTAERLKWTELKL